jgi:hypothetical protein
MWAAVTGFLSCFLCALTIDEYKDALIAIASVAAVIWTGAIIGLQLKGLLIELLGCMAMLQTAFIGALFVLLSSPLALHLVAIGFALYQYEVFFRYRRNVRKTTTSDTPQAKVHSLNNYATAVLLMATCELIVGITASVPLATWILTFVTYFGLNNLVKMLTTVNNVTAEVRIVDQPLTVSLAKAAQR